MQYLPVITGAVVLGIMFLALRKTIWPVIHQKRLHKTLLLSGCDADGIVLGVSQTGVYINHLPQVAIQLQVVPERGHNFVMEVKEILSVTELPTVQPGLKLKLKYNPHNHKQVIMLRDLRNT